MIIMEYILRYFSAQEKTIYQIIMHLLWFIISGIDIDMNNYHLTPRKSTYI